MRMKKCNKIQAQKSHKRNPNTNPSRSDNETSLQRVKFTRSIVMDLSHGRSPSIVIDRFRNYCSNPDVNCFCNSDLPKGQEILVLQRECHARRIDFLLRVLLIVQKLLQENRHGSKRDIYYMHPSVFKEQSAVDRAVNDICILMQCSRHNLNVVGKFTIFVSLYLRLVMGWLRFFEDGRKYNCINCPSTVRLDDFDNENYGISIYNMTIYLLWLQAHPVPVYVKEVTDIVSTAQYILVVEKESVFQRLANDRFCHMNRCIVVTGRGYPDIPTRSTSIRFLRVLTDTLRLPIYCLVDCDPYGFDILTTYRFGSMQLAYDAESLRIPEVRWLGPFPSDSEKYCIPQHCLLPLTIEDKRKIEAMLSRCYLHREVPQWRLELELMFHRGVKYEIEALSVHSLSFLSEVYIPSKIQELRYESEHPL
ncbi:meiotic recombination protein SPO11-1 [Tripterygium wilfordii]|uniref:DNA topoisomerase (ATP-hydrolyzing) n=1 Tax=Tripterygium wilfordii TaxID=458696 RepID=A0A7J7C8M1_TRIWF|nr:meiotic recombination protein SPO11-1 [Tripterygium wilfordii]